MVNGNSKRCWLKNLKSILFAKKINKNSSPFCCDDFLQCVDNAEKEGFTLFPELFDSELGAKFMLQCRIFYGTHIITDTGGVSFCPWCGSNLKKYITRHREFVLKMAEEKKYLLGPPPSPDERVFCTLGNTEPFEHKKRMEGQ